MPDQREWLRQLVENELDEDDCVSLLSAQETACFFTAGAWYAEGIKRREWLKQALALIKTDHWRERDRLTELVGLSQDMATWIVVACGSFAFPEIEYQSPKDGWQYLDQVRDWISTPEGRARALEALENYCEMCEEYTLDFMAGYVEGTEKTLDEMAERINELEPGSDIPVWNRKPGAPMLEGEDQLPRIGKPPLKRG